MKYRVDIAPEALAEADESYLWIRRESPSAAARWFNGLMDAIQSLELFPARCPLAPESTAFKQEIRQLLYRERAHAHRILFTVFEGTVRVLHIRHGARRFLRPDE